MSSSLEGLRSLLGVGSTAPAATPARSSTPAATDAGGPYNDLATLSSAGSQVSEAASGDGVRMDKVAAIQAALAAGTYNVSASAVASKLIDTMLGAH